MGSGSLRAAVCRSLVVEAGIAGVPSGLAGAAVDQRIPHLAHLADLVDKRIPDLADLTDLVDQRIAHLAGLAGAAEDH